MSPAQPSGPPAARVSARVPFHLPVPPPPESWPVLRWARVPPASKPASAVRPASAMKPRLSSRAGRARRAAAPWPSPLAALCCALCLVGCRHPAPTAAIHLGSRSSSQTCLPADPVTLFSLCPAWQPTTPCAPACRRFASQSDRRARCSDLQRFPGFVTPASALGICSSLLCSLQPTAPPSPFRSPRPNPPCLLFPLP